VRDDFLEAYWWVPGGFQGVGAPDYPDSPPSEEEILFRPRVFGEDGRPVAERTPVETIDRVDQVYAGPIEPGQEPRGVIVSLRTRVGFVYRRAVGLSEYVSLREASKLLGVPVMTVTRWIARKLIKPKLKNGHQVLKLRDVLNVARANRLSVLQGHRQIIPNAGPELRSALFPKKARKKVGRKRR
jgi:hypothetical protein